MTASTRAFHESLIRLAKGFIAAWQTWLDAQRAPAATLSEDEAESK